MRLSELLFCDRICIQCHDNPDADAIASGYGVYCFLKAAGKDVRLFYGGRNAVSKPNLVAMLRLLHIPLEHLPDLKSCEGLLLTVDCQYGAGNVSRVEAPHLAVIDHHIQEKELPPLSELKPMLGSCSTLAWSMLCRENFAIPSALNTALYYGLFTDTNSFAEVCHPLDRDMWDSLTVDERILKKLKGSNLSLDDLNLAAEALNTRDYHEDDRVMVVGAPPCDPNILGFISDLAMQVESVDIALVFSNLESGYKFSVRTDTRNARAVEIVGDIIAGGLGSGGGHADKAGGFIAKNTYQVRHGDTPFMQFCKSSVQRQLAAYDIIDCASFGGFAPDGFAAYEKLPVRLGYIPCRDVVPDRTKLSIRMLEGDIDISASDSTYLMIGISGEVYPIEEKKFLDTYTPSDEPFFLNTAYPPVIIDKQAGERIHLLQVAKSCSSCQKSEVMAKQLTQGIKIFTKWDRDNYFKGEPGDWLIVRKDDPTDAYVIKETLFPLLYARVHSVPLYQDVDIRQWPHCRSARKKGLPLSVRFADKPGVMRTLEGEVAYVRGDALASGVQNECWPISAAYFAQNYVPTPGTQPGQDGQYYKKPHIVDVARMTEAFSVTTANGSQLCGETGDWLVQYEQGHYGIVRNEIFAESYDLL